MNNAQFSPPHPADGFRLAKVLVLILSIVNILLLIRGIPEVYASTMRPCSAIATCPERHLIASDFEQLSTIGWSSSGYALYQTLTDLVQFVVFLPLAWILYVRLVRPNTPYRWFGLLTAAVLIALATTLIPLGPLMLAHSSPAWYRPYAVLKSINLVIFLLFMYTFPTGQLVFRGLIGLIVLVGLVGLIWVMTGNPDLDSSGRYGIAVAMFAVLCGVIAQFYRYFRTATMEQRQQTRWLVFGFIIGMISIIAWTSAFIAFPATESSNRLLINIVGWPFLMVGPLAFGISLAVAILRYRLWDIDLLINRTIVYTLLTAFIIGIYVVIVSALGAVFQSVSIGSQAGISLLATGVVTVSFQGLRDRIQRGVNRLMFGQRDEPLRVIERLGRQLKSTLTQEDLLNNAAQTISVALKVPYAAIRIRRAQEEVLQAESGVSRTPTMEFPLIYQNERVGTLVAGQRSPGETLSPADQSVLDSIAQQMSAVVHSVRLLAELQRSRERLVTAREEERRRLRRDLHDGLGPALASQTLKIDAALDLITLDPAEASGLLSEVKEQSQTLVADVRRLVYELRPPALDEIGLAGALSGAVMQMRAAERGLSIDLEMPDPLPELPAAVEVAAYRITMEAVTNVVRHAGARQCAVKFSLGEKPAQLKIVIEDDGKGLPTPINSGIGLQSMRERAEELGGSFAVANQDQGGVRVSVAIPLQKEWMA